MKIRSAYVVALKQAVQDLARGSIPIVTDIGELDEIGFYFLCDQIAVQIADPGFALHYGSLLHLGTHGVLGSALMSCRTLHDAAEFLVRHNPLRMMGGHIKFSIDGDDAILSMTGGIELPSTPDFLPQVFLMAVTNGVRELLGVELDGCHIEFAFQPSMPCRIYEQCVGIPVVFGATENRFVGPRDAIALPLAASDNEFADIFVRHCSKLLINQEQALNYAERVKQTLLNTKNKFSDESGVAQCLDVSPRTLRRRLSDEGTSFQKIQDQLRNEMAMACLSQTQMPIAEIGQLLGFEDVANFRRAFRRWNGCSPQDFRGVREL